MMCLPTLVYAHRKVFFPGQADDLHVFLWPPLPVMRKTGDVEFLNYQLDQISQGFGYPAEIVPVPKGIFFLSQESS